ncbi:unnamed protein product [Caenorhabditis auriculariae]|uniref:Uncharacterized protein n=1 Tax=Caenorhabditis auriculariae TaxID=2777116 RepID=A0A8S1H8C6_9PELO|nr:unnamed protein product [Caenorhabditis auriculariae]
MATDVVQEERAVEELANKLESTNLYQDYKIIPELSEEEQKLLDEEIAKRPKTNMPQAVDFPLHDIVKELKLDQPQESDPEFYEDLKTQPATIYLEMKDVPDAIGKKYVPDLARRFVETERRIKTMERMLQALPRPDRSLEDDRFEILTEVLDKACQGLEIWETHCERNIPIGKRLYLEGQLVHLINSKFDIIEKICKEFHKLKDKRDEVNNEREWLRYEIRHCDMMFTEIHERLLKSYIGMEW